MTLAAPAPDPAPPTPGTALGPSGRDLWSRSRGLLLALVIVLIAGFTLAALRSGGEHGRLDPRSADPYGSRAVAELLEDRGVSVRMVTGTAEATAAAGPDTTLLLAAPDLLTDDQRTAFRTATASSGGRTVLLAPGPDSVGALAPGVVAESPAAERTHEPACSLPAARRAGSADTGGLRYTTKAPGAEACYPSGELPTLLRLSAPQGGDTVLLGSPASLYNNRLDQHGNASLALQLLGSRPHLVWYLPSLADSSVPSGERSLTDLIPAGWTWASLQLAFAAALTVLWRARRFGPLVIERLPVAIRASETTEGRARLYRKANARDRAAQVLRGTTRSRLAPLLGVPPALADSPEAFLPALASHLTDPDRRDLHPLLFGPPPTDDAALITLADQLDALEREVRTS